MKITFNVTNPYEAKTGKLFEELANHLGKYHFWRKRYLWDSEAETMEEVSPEQTERSYDFMRCEANNVLPVIHDLITSLQALEKKIKEDA